jgi:plastocyanin
MLGNRPELILIAFIISFAITMVTCFESVEAQEHELGVRIVAAGGGNSTSPLTAFVPENIEIKVGDSILWNNPTPVSEPHSVTFINNNKYLANFVAPFRVPNSTQFQSLDPNSNARPFFAPIPGQPPQTRTVVTVNDRAFIPVVIDSTGKNVTYLPLNSNYTMDGTENYINSGWLWPKGQIPPGSPPITKFTVTFEKPGTFAYLCNVHPWMKGTVTVK